MNHIFCLFYFLNVLSFLSGFKVLAFNDLNFFRWFITYIFIWWAFLVRCQLLQIPELWLDSLEILLFTLLLYLKGYCRLLGLKLEACEFFEVLQSAFNSFHSFILVLILTFKVTVIKLQVFWRVLVTFVCLFVVHVSICAIELLDKAKLWICPLLCTGIGMLVCG